MLARRTPARPAAPGAPPRTSQPTCQPTCTSTGTPARRRVPPPRPHRGRDRTSATPPTGMTCPGAVPAPDSSAAQGPEPAPGRTSKLEQIREFYLTAEAIGEQNVDKHFDQLLAQQRELISEYFKQPPAAAQAGADHDGAVTPDHPGAPGDPGGAGSAGGQADAAHGASVAAEQPRVW